MAVFLSFLANVATAAVDPFYLGIYHRGMTQFEAGDFASAARSLRLAAFGLVESLEQFETAHVYAAIASSKAGSTDEAKVSIERIIAAERITRTYAHLTLPAPVRAQFETIAKAAVPANAYAFLTSPDAPAPPRNTPRVVVQVPPTAVAARSDPPAGSSADRPSNGSSGSNGNGGSSAPPASSVPATSTPRAASPPSDPVPGSGKTLADADHAAATGDLATARAIYVAQLENPRLAHADLLRAAEGLCRSRDFRGAVTAFTRAGALTKGEERSHYYFAVSLYEIGQYREAKRELASGLSFVEKSPEVESYRAKIEGAVE